MPFSGRMVLKPRSKKYANHQLGLFIEYDLRKKARTKKMNGTGYSNNSTQSFVEERELFGDTYTVMKEYRLSPASIKYIMSIAYSEEFTCTISFTGIGRKQDKNFLYDYLSAEEAIVDSMFQHLRRSLLIRDANKTLEDIKREKRLAAFDAKVARQQEKKKKI